MTLTNEIIDDLLADLDNYARDVDGCEYGLPIWDDHIEAMREIVRSWLKVIPR